LARPLSDTGVRIISSCARSFVPFFLKHRRLFENDRGVPVCESYTDDNDLMVRFTVPYQAYALFEIEEPPHAPSTLSRPSGFALKPDEERGLGAARLQEALRS